MQATVWIELQDSVWEGLNNKKNSLAQSQKKIAVGNSHNKWKKKKKRLLALFQRLQTISITGVSKGDGLAQGLGLAPSILPSS